jgi:hypothetical protein
VRSARRTPSRQSSTASRSTSYNTANFTGLNTNSGNQQTSTLSPGSALSDHGVHVSPNGCANGNVNGNVNGLHSKPAAKPKRRSLLRRADSLEGLFLDPDRRRDLQRLSVQLSLPLSLIVARVEALVAGSSTQHHQQQQQQQQQQQ